MGSAASWERWDAGSIPGPAQQVKDLVLPQLWFKSQLQLRYDPWPRNSLHNREAKKEKKKRGGGKKKERGIPKGIPKP